MTSWVGPAASKIAEWVVTSVVTSLVNTAYSCLCDRRLPDDSKAELKRLSIALPKIKAVMGIAEALKKKDPSTGLWVDQFRQAVEVSQLVLNELDYLNRDEAGESSSSSKKRKRCVINDDTMKRLKDAVTMMDGATAEIDHLLRLATVLGVLGSSTNWFHTECKGGRGMTTVVRRAYTIKDNKTICGRVSTNCFGTTIDIVVASGQEASEVSRVENQVFFREVEKHNIFDWLKQAFDAWLSSLGTEKHGYKNMDVLNYSDKTIWIILSTDFSVQGITTNIVVELREDYAPGITTKPLNELLEASKENIFLKEINIVGDIFPDYNQIVGQIKIILGNPLFAKVIRDYLIPGFLLEETIKYQMGFLWRIQGNVSQL